MMQLSFWRLLLSIAPLLLVFFPRYLLAFQDEQVWSIAGVSGASSSLPCPLNPRKQGDKPKLILWYKRGNKIPLFSYDSRLPSAEASNGQMRIDPVSARLTFQALVVDDAGFYECRVDFYHSPTNTNLVNLTVIEPPYSVEIFDKFSGAAKDGVLGPYQENQSIILTCLARGGTPRPNITWWDDASSTALTDTSPPIEGVSPHIIQSDLFIENMNREWHNRTLTCTGFNSRLVRPVESRITLDMFLLPTSLTISYKKPAQEGTLVQLKCVTQGSRPAADLTWSVRGLPLTGTSKVSLNSLSTSSVVNVNVTREDNEKEVECKAKNPAIDEKGLSNSTLLIVNYSPKAKALLGPSLSPSLLKEGDDVYFVCEVDSNPKAENIQWFHEGVKISQMKSRGFILSGNSLVLQKVRRQRAGKYTCVATNNMGSDTSAPVFLKVKYKPECITTPTTYFIYDQPINVTCSVSSHPFASRMYWRWNSGSDVMNVRPFSSTLQKDASSLTKKDDFKATGRLTVFPSKNSEDRELSCWAENEMGTQHIPCSFSIKVAQIPAPLTSCRLANITASSLSLSCEKPHGVISAATIYRAELYLHNKTLFANVTSSRPSFNVSRLDPGTSYKIKVYVSRGPVTSLPVVVLASTFRRSRVEASTSGGETVLSGTIVLCCLLLLLFNCQNNLEELMKIHKRPSTSSSSNSLEAFLRSHQEITSLRS